MHNSSSSDRSAVSLATGVRVESIADEVVVLAPTSRAVHRLHGEPARLLRLVHNGHLDIAHCTPDERATLAALGELGLVVTAAPDTLHRRTLLVGATAAAALGVTTMMLPSAAAAASTDGGSGPLVDACGAPNPPGELTVRFTDFAGPSPYDGDIEFYWESPNGWNENQIPEGSYMYVNIAGTFSFIDDEDVTQTDYGSLFFGSLPVTFDDSFNINDFLLTWTAPEEPERPEELVVPVDRWGTYYLMTFTFYDGCDEFESSLLELDGAGDPLIPTASTNEFN